MRLLRHVNFAGVVRHLVALAVAVSAALAALAVVALAALAVVVGSLVVSVLVSAWPFLQPSDRQMFAVVLGVVVLGVVVLVF